ncbi:VIT domain-containing protein [uncultured Nonlabens sp.]|uniref:VIT domain-containing protein n=1 Tax=uncultured Nonlabens sp. TaxID=859306 RepID=UPI00260B418D|nr:VIT domain-containing protein [uncultured Nonlabens sp.]
MFYNPTSHILEGELNFPLGDGHEVSRFALDVNGTLRDAVVVDKELGRIAFEEVVRRGVDPALLEKGTGNNYKARIYPIPANGHKHVVLAYEQELTYENEAHYYQLPLRFKSRIDDFHLRIEFLDQSKKPVLVDGQLSGLKFTDWQHNYVTDLRLEEFRADTNLKIKIPTDIQNDQLSVSGDHFYYYQTFSNLKKKRASMKEVTLLWDASLSMKDREIEKELAFLNLFFKENQDIKVNLQIFSNKIMTHLSDIKIRNGKWNTLKEILKNQTYDGGTDYSNIINKSNTDAYLLFTDGLKTLSNSDFYPDAPVFIINSLKKSNAALLKKWARASRGNYINLVTYDTAAAYDMIKYMPLEYLGYVSNNKQIEILPRATQFIDNNFSLYGKNVNAGESIHLLYGYNGKVTLRKTIKISKDLNNQKQIKKYWAQQKIAELALNKKENKKAITDLAVQYQLVTDFTSLIVLEEVRDYLRYKIEPPAELKQEYDLAIAQMKRDSIAMANNNDKAKNKLIEVFQNEMEDQTPPPGRPNSSVIQRLQGQTSGLNVESSSGQQGVYNNIQARETNSLYSDRTTNTRINRFINSEDYPAAPAMQEAPRALETEPELDEIVVQGYPSTTRDYENTNQQNLLRAEQESRKQVLKQLVVSDRKVQVPYLTALRATNSVEAAYQLYLTNRENYKEQPAYFIDVAHFFREERSNTLFADRILSNVAEIDFDNYELLKVYGYQLEKQAKLYEAIFIFNRVLELRPEDSQSYRDLAIAYETAGLCKKAFALYHDIITGKIYEKGNRRVFPSMESISRTELKRLASKYQNDLKDVTVDKELLKEETYDLRILVDWNHNDTDIDLHIVDPNLEECFYSHPTTKMGGQLSKDMTQGFGPEQFTLSQAKKGDYYIKVKYYGDRYQKVENPTFMKITLIRNYGRPNETKELKIIRLTHKDDIEVVAKITF